jgi:hypothetical protein
VFCLYVSACTMLALNATRYQVYTLRKRLAFSLTQFFIGFSCHLENENLHSDRFETAVAAILLAGKTEESPKKLVVVIDESYKVKLRGMQAGRISQAAVAAGTSGMPSPQSMTNMSAKFDPKSEEFIKLKERILLLERVILHTIGFELSVDHPYKFLVDLCKRLTQKRLIEYASAADNAPAAGNPTQVYAGMMNSLVQYSMNFANDSMQTSLCLQFVPQKVAVSCCYLACHCAKVKPVDPKTTWLDLLGNPDVESLASIVLQIGELITERKGTDAALFDRIKADLDALRGADAGGDAEAKPSAESTSPSPVPDAKRQRTN